MKEKEIKGDLASYLFELIIEISVILFVFIIFSSIKIILNITDFEYIGILIVSVLSIVGVFVLGNTVGQKLENNDVKIKLWKIIFLEFILISGLSLLSFYAFFIKGLYDTYLFFHNFNFWGLIYHIFIIIFTYKLIVLTSEIQDVFKLLRKNKI